MEELDKLVHAIEISNRMVFFGGAGVSTESGLKDYRSKDGIYKTARNYGRPPEEILSHDCLMNEPELFYRFFRDFFLDNVEPNLTHRVLAALESPYRRVSIVTQNIDGLHQIAGSTRVYELHGSASRYACVVCGKRFSRVDVISSKTNIPKCECCGGMIRPLVTMYSEMLDDNVVENAITEISQADLLVIGGTSLAVYPAASFVRYFKGDTIAIVNREPTPYDNRCRIVIHDTLGHVFKHLAIALNLTV